MITYTKKEVINLLKKQRYLCSKIPLLNKSRSRTDWREWNKFLTNMSKSINDVPLIKE